MTAGGPLETADAIQLLADGLALSYHEARHVRILTKAGHLPLDAWASFVDLPRDGVEAWRTLMPKRLAAAAETDALAAAAVFATEFGRTAADLAVLYANPNWRQAAALGGPPWGRVMACVLTLRDTIAARQTAEMTAACARLVNARDVNGPLRARIVDLDQSVRHDSHRLWRHLPVSS